MPSPSPLRMMLRAIAHHLAARLAKKGLESGRETELIFCPPWEITIQAASLDTRSPRVNIPPLVRRLLDPAVWKEQDLSPLHQALIESATDKPQTAKTLARLAGYPYNSRLRQALADLARAELLSRGPDGYRRKQ